jgi:SAM-dependent methyltransferase
VATRQDPDAYPQDRQGLRPLQWGDLRRLTPVGRSFGFDRGQPIDRYYIEGFLQRHSTDIRGRVLEVGDPGYTRRFGGDRVTRADVLHVEPGNPHATLVGELATGQGIPRAAFDCLIVTQTLFMIYDIRGAVANAHAALKPGGVLLATLPGISQVVRYDMDRWGDYWRFTTRSAGQLFAEVFPAANVTVEAHGNVLAAVGFLHGLSANELLPEELDSRDDDYQLLITVRASRPGGGAGFP